MTGCTYCRHWRHSGPLLHPWRKSKTIKLQPTLRETRRHWFCIKPGNWTGERLSMWRIRSQVYTALLNKTAGLTGTNGLFSWVSRAGNVKYWGVRHRQKLSERERDPLTKMVHPVTVGGHVEQMRLKARSQQYICYSDSRGIAKVCADDNGVLSVPALSADRWPLPTWPVLQLSPPVNTPIHQTYCVWNENKWHMDRFWNNNLIAYLYNSTCYGKWLLSFTQLASCCHC